MRRKSQSGSGRKERAREGGGERKAEAEKNRSVTQIEGRRTCWRGVYVS